MKHRSFSDGKKKLSWREAKTAKKTSRKPNATDVSFGLNRTKLFFTVT